MPENCVHPLTHESPMWGLTQNICKVIIYLPVFWILLQGKIPHPRKVRILPTLMPPQVGEDSADGCIWERKPNGSLHTYVGVPLSTLPSGRLVLFYIEQRKM